MKHNKTIASLFSALVLLIVSPLNAQDVVPGEFIVKLKSDREMTKSVYDIGYIREVIEDDTVVVERPMFEKSSFALSAMMDNENVEYVEPNYIYKTTSTEEPVEIPNDTFFKHLWGLENKSNDFDISALEAWKITKGSKDIVVAVIDTGVNYNHPDLKENMWVNEAEKNGVEGVDDDGNGYVDDIYGYDFKNDDGDPMDKNGHGTHCAGTIGARGNNGTGVVGVAWEVKLMALQFLGGKNGSGSTADAIKSINYAVEMGANVLSNSWGGGGKSKALEDAIKKAAKKGLLFVAAAGNNGKNTDRKKHYPSSYKVENIISVAAIDRGGKKPRFSNYGKKSVDLAAPGVSIFSTYENRIKALSGTSMATPHVSGVAALLLSENPNMTAVELKKRLMDTAKPVKSMKRKSVTGSMVDAHRALTNTKRKAWWRRR